MINRKALISAHDLFCNMFHKFRYSYSVSQKLSDIEKVFDFLSGTVSGSPCAQLWIPLRERRLMMKYAQGRNIIYTGQRISQGSCRHKIKEHSAG